MDFATSESPGGPVISSAGGIFGDGLQILPDQFSSIPEQPDKIEIQVDREQKESSQSQVLYNSDLLEVVMSFLNESGAPSMPICKPESTYLLWASLTCKTFFNPAMNVLWKWIDSWSVILHLLPALDTSLSGPLTPIYTTTQVILPEHLERLDFYVRKIRSFNFESDPEKQPIAPQIYTAIAQIRQFKLFPSLTRLNIPHLDQISDSNIYTLFLTTSPTLVEISMFNEEKSKEIYGATLLNNLCATSELICKVTLEGIWGSVSLQTLKAFNNLNILRLTLESLDLSLTDLLAHLSSTRSLQHLYVNISKMARETRSLMPLQMHSFLSLKTLAFTCPQEIAEKLTAYLGTLPKLVEFFIHFTSSSSSTSTPDTGGRCIKNLVRTDTNLPKAPTLRKFQVTSQECMYPVHLHFPIIGQISLVLETLSLEVLHLSSSELLCLSLCQESNHLRNLKLISQKQDSYMTHRRSAVKLGRKGVQNTSRPSYGPLRSSELPLARSFSNLIKLHVSITLDVTHIKEMKTIQQTTQRCHRLQELILEPHWRMHDINQLTSEFATVMNAFTLARFIDHIFPRLKKLDMSGFIKIAGAEWSRAVESMVMEFQDIQKLHSHELCL